MKTPRWYYLSLGTIAMLFLGMLYAWSIFRAPLAAMFTTWTPSQMSLTFSISMIMFCAGNIISGKLAEKLSSRAILLLAALLLFVGFMGASYSLSPDNPGLSLALLYSFYGVCCGLGVGIGYNCLVGTLLRWFPDRVGMASGMLLMGFGLGGLALGSIVNMCITIFGLLTTLVGIALSITGVLTFSALFIKTPDTAAQKHLAYLRGKASSTLRQPSRANDLTPSQMLKTSTFWCFFLWLICVSSGGLLVINSAAPIAVFFGAPAAMGLIVSLFNGGGRIFFGLLFDRYGGATTLVLNSVLLLLSGLVLFMAAKANSPFLLFIGLPLVGLSFSGAPSITSATVNSIWGAKHFPANFGVTNCNLIPAALIGPMISSSLQERSGGSYDTTFLMLIVFGCISIMLGLVLYRRFKPRR